MHTVFVKQDKFILPRLYIEQAIEFFALKLKKKHDLKDKELVLVFVSASEMKRLNHQFRDKNYVTDVLSFDPIEENSLGELIFCAEKIRLQAIENKQSFRDELSYLTLHGILHLLGYEHECGGQKAKEMFKLQDAIFAAFVCK